MPDWPQNRASPFVDITELTDLRFAWDFSAKRIQRLRDAVQSHQLPSPVACVAISGSLARMEAHEKSDLDLLVVVDDRQATITDQTMSACYESVWQCLAQAVPDCQLTPPKPGGVFSCCASWRQMTDESVRGIVNEDMTTYGQRMQLLLDVQPICGHDKFSELQRELLIWYSESRIAALFAEAGPFHWLWQEVQRYWYSIRARACWLFADAPVKSLEVNVKLRSSRMLLIAAFLSSITAAHDANTSESAVDRMLELCRLTPLERVTSAIALDRVNQFLIDYETAWKFCQSIDNIVIPPRLSESLKNLALVLQPLTVQSAER